MQTKDKVLIVLAHPDDESFLCGGTIAKLSEQGVYITLLCATRGEMGRRLGIPILATRESLPKLRELELKRACEELGINDLRYLNLRDKTIEFENDELLVSKIVNVIREIQPQVVLTFHEKYGGHPDHCAIGRATTLGFTKSGDENFCTDNAFSPYKAQRLYFVLWHTFLGELSHLNNITKVNIAGTMQKKIQALKSHRSQTKLVTELWGQNPTSLPFLKEYEYFLREDYLEITEGPELF